jgi:hypothetical protein
MLVTAKRLRQVRDAVPRNNVCCRPSVNFINPTIGV